MLVLSSRVIYSSTLWRTRSHIIGFLWIAVKPRGRWLDERIHDGLTLLPPPPSPLFCSVRVSSFMPSLVWLCPSPVTSPSRGTGRDRIFFVGQNTTHHNTTQHTQLHVGGTRRNLVLPPALVESFFRGAITAIKDEV